MRWYSCFLLYALSFQMDIIDLYPNVLHTTQRNLIPLPQRPPRRRWARCGARCWGRWRSIRR